MMTNIAEASANGAEAEFAAIQAKYEQEKERRLRQDGSDQYVELWDAKSDRVIHLDNDPFVDHETLNKKAPCLNDGDNVKFLILGAGFGGLLYAINLLKNGFKKEDIRMVDAAGGFGGTWYWNRYPGLICDIESSIYMPLLEDMGYRPTLRYPHGYELLEYANLMAKKWGLVDVASWRTRAKSFEWDEDARRWRVALVENRGPSEAAKSFKVTAQFTFLANGVFNYPKVPKTEGMEKFEGQILHTARWDYGISGGTHENWELPNFKGKKVGIIGTGATGIQVVSQAHKWAGELFVFSRTPPAVDERGQRTISNEEWENITAEPGWQRKRSAGWSAAISGEEGYEDHVADRWTTIPGYRYLVGGPHDKTIPVENVPQHVGQALAMDVPRMERLRKRVEDIVKDKETAEALKPWYPSWCKRPLFSDEWLPTFNQPNVKLVDVSKTKGEETITPKGMVVDGKEYELDILIFATGYRAPGVNFADPAKFSEVKVSGRNSNLSEKWEKNGPSTVHGLWSNSFPNMVFTGPTQAGVSSNYVLVQDILAEQAGYTIGEATKRVVNPDKLVIEATEEAENEWGMKFVMDGTWLAPSSVCGPSYINAEGVKRSQEDMIKAVRGASYTQGLNSYIQLLKDWRDASELKGLTISG